MDWEMVVWAFVAMGFAACIGCGATLGVYLGKALIGPRGRALIAGRGGLAPAARSLPEGGRP